MPSVFCLAIIQYLAATCLFWITCYVAFLTYRAAEAMHRRAVVGAPVRRGGNVQHPPLPLLPQPQPQPNPEPPGLEDGGEIRVPCTLMRVDAKGITPVDRHCDNPIDQYLNNQTSDAFSLLAPSDDILLWVNRGGTELFVFNVRMQMIIKVHEIKVAPQCVGVVVSKRVVIFTSTSGFVVVASEDDTTFRKIEVNSVGSLVSGHPAAGQAGRPVRTKAMMGRSMYLLDDAKEGKTILILLADPPLALFYRVNDIIACTQTKAMTLYLNKHDVYESDLRPGETTLRRIYSGSHSSTVDPHKRYFMDNLPSRNRLGVPPDTHESAIMMLENRVLFGLQPVFGALENWSWFDVKTGAVREERIAAGQNGEPVVQHGDVYRIRLNPVNLYEIYVHISNNHAGGHRKNELWVMGMSTQMETFHWKRRERPPSLATPSILTKMTLQTPMDWATTPSGTMYVRWIDYEAMAGYDQYIYEFRSPHGFTLTRVENRVSPLHSLCERVLQGFVQQPFREMKTRRMERILINYEDRRRAAVTGAVTHVDFVRYVFALYLRDTTHCYYPPEQVYDDSNDLIEHQQRMIEKMEETPFRSLFGTLFASANKRDIRPAMKKRVGGGGDGEMVEEVENGGEGGYEDELECEKEGYGRGDGAARNKRRGRLPMQQHGQQVPRARQQQQAAAAVAALAPDPLDDEAADAIVQLQGAL